MKALLTLIGIFVAAYVLNAQDYSFNVEVSGSGQPVIMIPGVSSSGAVWDETVKTLKSNYECHVVTLPGFAGQPSVQRDTFLLAMGDELIQYVRDQQLESPVIMGHSLGGFLTAYIGATAPELASKLIIVDGLAYMGASQNPMATTESMKETALIMRKNIELQTPEQYEETQPFVLKSMISDSANVAIAMEWGRQSDNQIVAQAMYELFQIDIRSEMSKVTAPTLILGSWAGYKNYGVTKAMVQSSFAHQFQLLENKRIVLSETGKHFIMWDDPEFFMKEVTTFLESKS